MAHHDRAEHLILVKGIVILLQDREALARRDLDRAARRLELAREQLQERRFASAVRANDAIAVARRELQVDVLVEDALAELEAQVVRGNHRRVVILSLSKINRYSLRMARNIERMLWPYELPGTAQRPLRSSQAPSVLSPYVPRTRL